MAHVTHCKNKIMSNGSFVSKSQAYQNITTDILTRARHFNCLVVFFVHSIDTFDKKDQIDRLIMFDDSMVQKLNNLKFLKANRKKMISIAADKLFKNPEYNHMFLYYCISSNHIAVGKANLHAGESIELNDATKQYINIYNDILSGFKTVSNKENEEQEQSEEYEEDGDADDIEGII